jgi:hypothetical protein
MNAKDIYDDMRKKITIQSGVTLSKPEVNLILSEREEREKMFDEMLEALIDIVKFHNKYDVGYSLAGKDTIKCVIHAKNIIARAEALNDPYIAVAGE